MDPTLKMLYLEVPAFHYFVVNGNNLTAIKQRLGSLALNTFEP